MQIRTSLNGGDRGFLLDYIKPGTIGAELGVWKGEFSLIIKNQKKPKLLYLIDPWIAYLNAVGVLKEDDVKPLAEDDRYQLVLQKFSDGITNGSVKVIRKYTPCACLEIPDNSLDWIYVDAGHAYHEVKEDLKNILPKMKKGSIIMGDDYNPNAWVGVVQAVDEFIVENNIHLIEFQNCQYVLEVL